MAEDDNMEIIDVESLGPSLDAVHFFSSTHTPHHPHQHPPPSLLLPPPHPPHPVQQQQHPAPTPHSLLHSHFVNSLPLSGSGGTTAATVYFPQPQWSSQLLYTLSSLVPNFESFAALTPLLPPIFSMPTSSAAGPSTSPVASGSSSSSVSSNSAASAADSSPLDLRVRKPLEYATCPLPPPPPPPTNTSTFLQKPIPLDVRHTLFHSQPQLNATAAMLQQLQHQHQQQQQQQQQQLQQTPHRQVIQRQLPVQQQQQHRQPIQQHRQPIQQHRQSIQQQQQQQQQHRQPVHHRQPIQQHRQPLPQQQPRQSLPMPKLVTVHHYQPATSTAMYAAAPMDTIIVVDDDDDKTYRNNHNRVSLAVKRRPVVVVKERKKPVSRKASNPVKVKREVEAEMVDPDNDDEEDLLLRGNLVVVENVPAYANIRKAQSDDESDLEMEEEKEERRDMKDKHDEDDDDDDDEDVDDYVDDDDDEDDADMEDDDDEDSVSVRKIPLSHSLPTAARLLNRGSLPHTSAPTKMARLPLKQMKKSYRSQWGKDSKPQFDSSSTCSEMDTQQIQELFEKQSRNCELRLNRYMLGRSGAGVGSSAGAGSCSSSSSTSAATTSHSLQSLALHRWSPDDERLRETAHLLNEFYQHQVKREMTKFNKLFCSLQKLETTFGNVSLKDIYNMTNTELWRRHCVYGRKLRKYLCKVKSWPVPVVAHKKWKIPLKNEGKAMRTEKSDQTQLVSRSSPKNQVAIHEFCFDVLLEPYYESAVIWKDKKRLLFMIKDAKKLASLWMKVKDNEILSVDNFTRGIRLSRTRLGFFKKVVPQKKRVYQLTLRALTDYVRRRKVDA